MQAIDYQRFHFDFHSQSHSYEYSNSHSHSQLPIATCRQVGDTERESERENWRFIDRLPEPTAIPIPIPIPKCESLDPFAVVATSPVPPLPLAIFGACQHLFLHNKNVNVLNESRYTDRDSNRDRE